MPKVVIIDDEEGVLQMYKTKLDMEGFQSFTALDGQTGISIIKKEKPDVILLDIIMPRVNGFDVLKILKEDKETKDIPVFLLTNLPQEAGGAKGTELGAAGYLVKADYEPATLAKMIKGVITKNQK
jgi:DNA-binding response OmpR family regulator